MHSDCLTLLKKFTLGRSEPVCCPGGCLQSVEYFLGEKEVTLKPVWEDPEVDQTQ